MIEGQKVAIRAKNHRIIYDEVIFYYDDIRRNYVMNEKELKIVNNMLEVIVEEPVEDNYIKK